jgi:hypothetical protein
MGRGKALFVFSGALRERVGCKAVFTDACVHICVAWIFVEPLCFFFLRSSIEVFCSSVLGEEDVGSFQL